MNLSLILARLKSQLTGLKAVGQSADFAAAKAGMLALPGMFVVPLREAGTVDEMTSATSQQVAQTFGVVIGLRNQRDALGGAALDDLHPHRLALRAALVGWVPDADTGEPVHFTSGRLLEIDAEQRLWWMDEFQLTTYYWSA